MIATAVGASIVWTAPVSAQERHWGLSAADWLVLPGDAFRAKLRAGERRAEIERAAKAGDVEAMAIAAGALATSTWGAPDYAAAHAYATAAAEAGVPRAMVVLGTLTSAGNGTAKDSARAYRWFARAAELGQVQAMVLAGFHLVNGDGVAKDQVAAVDLFGRAATFDNPEGLYQLAVCQFNGNGTEKNVSAAYATMRRAAEFGSVEGMYWFGKWMAVKEIAGDLRDVPQSTLWIKKAADAGHFDATLAYAGRLWKGVGTPADPSAAALKLNSLIADTGAPQARFALAYPLQSDENATTQYRAIAATLYGRVIEDPRTQPDMLADAFFNLALVHMTDGRAGLARTYFLKAQSAGHAQAAQSIARLDAQQLAAKPAVAPERRSVATLPPTPIRRPTPVAPRATPVAARTAAVSGAVPSATDILKAHAAANVKYQGGSLTSTPGEHAVPSPFGGIAYYRRRSLANLSCTPRGGGVVRCSYDLTVVQRPAEDSLFGQFTSVLVPDFTTRWTYDYVKTRAGWFSNGLDESIASDASGVRVAARDGEAKRYRDEEEFRKRESKRTECMSRAIEYGHAPIC
ncbi:tetratricopeptide repeat protein [Sphingomonas sp. RS2018]